ncbi:hypothetical protein HPB52_004997 [Rhipicephalus sanguineus]|uniref:THAP-type domain-containing protein n=1 Tax=Rhipicephalus sanguineus TaxID=34632 RepID=A0A9D4QB44_RHISA|nr:hypothetical protein HPB52_004997 [Rhipicephalus sanguineus]
MSKRRTDSHCFAAGCRSGNPGAPKASLFTAPRDDDLHRKCEPNLRRDDKPLTETSAVCEHHFEPRYILLEYVHVINGCDVRIPREKPLSSVPFRRARPSKDPGDEKQPNLLKQQAENGEGLMHLTKCATAVKWKA